MKKPRLYLYELANYTTYLIQYPDLSCEYYFNPDKTWKLSAWAGPNGRLDKQYGRYFTFVGYL